jgi:predicted amidophosphoribosyltransferase
MTQFKFQDHFAWAAYFALLMRSAPWIERALDNAELVIPMPLAPERLRQRGFNQRLYSRANCVHTKPWKTLCCVSSMRLHKAP